MTVAQRDDALAVGEFLIMRHPEAGYWIQHARGPRSGEGMQVKAQEFERLVEKFYEDNF